MTRLDVEEALFRSFIRRERVERYVALLRTPQRRRRILGELHHFYNFDGRYVFSLDKHEDAPLPLYETLRNMGAPETCYLIGASEEGEDSELLDALYRFHATGDGVLISCIPDRLAYYEGEDQRFILARRR